MSDCIRRCDRSQRYLFSEAAVRRVDRLHKHADGELRNFSTTTLHQSKKKKRYSTVYTDIEQESFPTRVAAAILSMRIFLEPHPPTIQTSDHCSRRMFTRLLRISIRLQDISARIHISRVPKFGAEDLTMPNSRGPRDLVALHQPLPRFAHH
jgi:hypothetical protein